MFHNYLITALRNFTRHKLYSFINISGLTVGLTCAIFIILFVRDELSYDKWIPGTESLYRVEGTWSYPGQSPVPTSGTTFAAPEAIAAQLPEVIAAVHLEPWKMTVATGNRQFLDAVNVVSPNFFQIIKLPLIAGDRSTLFAQPEFAVISESAARKYFGSKNAIGRMIHVVGGCEWEVPGGCHLREASVVVTGIMRDLPHNTQLSGDVFIPNTSAADPLSQHAKANWGDVHGFGYILLRPGTDLQAVEAKIPALIDTNFDPKKSSGLSVRGSEVLRIHLNPFRDDHLSTDGYGNSMVPAGSWTTVYGFMVIGVLILLTACFNFTNLATARAAARAREISLRKTLGARRAQVMTQFLGESVLMALMSVVLALGLVEVLLPLFDRMIGKPIHLHYLNDLPLLLALVALAIMAGLLAGFYPALVLSGFRPASTLRTNSNGQSGSRLLRTALVMMQFSVSIGLGIATVVVFSQLSFARAIDLGLNRQGIVVVDTPGLTETTKLSLAHALDDDPALKGAALSGGAPFEGWEFTRTVEVPGLPGTSSMRTVPVGPNFFSLYNIRLLSGRPLSDSRAQDIWRNGSRSANVLINEAAAKRFGYSPQSALGKTLAEEEDDDETGGIRRVQLTIVGVTSDFVYEGDRKKIVPTFYAYYPPNIGSISVRTPPAGLLPALSAIDRIWHRFSPSIAINRHFLDEDFDKQFLADEQQSRVFEVFVGIAILIAAMGLFGLAAFSTARRTKEIGIRKTFGARTRDVILLLLWQFSIPVLVANLIAWPVAYYYLRQWLDGYAYRISLNPLYFVGAGAVALVIAWATVIVHAVHVARANPINALRYE